MPRPGLGTSPCPLDRLCPSSSKLYHRLPTTMLEVCYINFFLFFSSSTRYCSALVPNLSPIEAWFLNRGLVSKYMARNHIEVVKSEKRSFLVKVYTFLQVIRLIFFFLTFTVLNIHTFFDSNLICQKVQFIRALKNCRHWSFPWRVDSQIFVQFITRAAVLYDFMLG